MGILEDGLDALGGLFKKRHGSTDVVQFNLLLTGGLFWVVPVAGTILPQQVTKEQCLSTMYNVRLYPAHMILIDAPEVVDSGILRRHSMFLKVLRPQNPCLLKD